MIRRIADVTNFRDAAVLSNIVGLFDTTIDIEVDTPGEKLALAAALEAKLREMNPSCLWRIALKVEGLPTYLRVLTVIGTIIEVTMACSNVWASTLPYQANDSIANKLDLLTLFVTFISMVLAIFLTSITAIMGYNSCMNRFFATSLAGTSVSTCFNDIHNKTPEHRAALTMVTEHFIRVLRDPSTVPQPQEAETVLHIGAPL